MGALAPSRWLGKHGYTAGGWETAIVRLLPTGQVEAMVHEAGEQRGPERDLVLGPDEGITLRLG
jgi:aerobic carbon-monoxide dehydrogenase large subunit